MKPHPEERDLLALKGETVNFKLYFEEGAPAEGPTFFLNGELQPTIRFGGEMSISIVTDHGDEKEESDSDSIEFEDQSSTSLTFEKSGYNKVAAVWSTDPEVDIEELSVDEGDDLPDDCSVHRWNVYVVDEETHIDEVRQIVDDLIRGTTAIYGGKKLIQWIRSKVETGEEPEEPEDSDDEEYFQQNITNY